MDNEEKLYGRKRVKKTRPVTAPNSKPAESGSPGEAVDNKPDTVNEIAIERKKTDSDQANNSDKIEIIKKNERFGPNGGKKQPPRSKFQGEKTRDKSQSRQKTRPARATPPGASRVRVSVIIPAYNEQDNISPLMEMFDEVIRSERGAWEVVLVNDGSDDKTLDRVKHAASKYRWLRYITYSNNRGLTSALNAGFKSARGSILVFYPADLQYHPRDIPKLLEKIDKGADLVAGWKQGKYSKRFVSYVYNSLCRALFGLKIHDMNSVKAFKKEVAASMSARRDWHRYLIVTAAEEGYRIDEAKIKLYPRRFGKSKFGFGRILGGVLDLFSVKFQITFMKKPLRFFGTWGIVFGGAGVIVGLIALYLRFFTGFGSRTLLFPTMLLILVGLMLFAIGFLAEVLVGLKDEIESLKRN